MAAAERDEQGGSRSASVDSGLAPIQPAPFGKYTLVAKLGQGATAEVFLAVATGLAGFRKLVVIKRLHPHLLEEPGILEMFLDEARLAARLNHPHVVQTHEVGEVDHSRFMALEYLDGQSLDRILGQCQRTGTRVPIDVAARVVADALDGLHHAHELTDYDGSHLGVVHRDVSPHNVFVTYDGVVKLLDFGVAKAATHIARTETGVIKGKYAYIAPEQALADQLDRRADLWSMGVVLWETLTGRRLFKGDTEVRTLQRALTEDAPLPSEVNPDVSPELDAITRKALQRDAEERYQTALEMKEDLERYLAKQRDGTGRAEIGRFLNEIFGDSIQQRRESLRTFIDGEWSTAPLDPSHALHAADRHGSASRPTRALQTRRVLLLILAGVGLIGIGVALAFLMPNSPSGEPRRPPGLTLPAPRKNSATPPTTAEDVAQPLPLPTRPPVATDDSVPREDDKSASRARARTSKHAAKASGEVAEEGAPKASTEEQGEGFLTFDTVPWSVASIGDRELGATPLIRVPLPAGAHVLTLRNPELNKTTTFRVTIRPGETTSRRIGLE